MGGQKRPGRRFPCVCQHFRLTTTNQTRRARPRNYGRQELGSQRCVWNLPRAKIFYLPSKVIPDNSKLRFITRGPTRDDVVELRERVKLCFEFVHLPNSSIPILFHSSRHFSAAALATGCKHNVKLEVAYDDLVQNSVLGVYTPLLLEHGSSNSES